MTTKSFFFYGYVDGKEDSDEVWKVLHDHFEKLASKDNDAHEEVRGKGVTRKK